MEVVLKESWALAQVLTPFVTTYTNTPNRIDSHDIPKNTTTYHPDRVSLISTLDRENITWSYTLLTVSHSSSPPSQFFVHPFAPILQTSNKVPSPSSVSSRCFYDIFSPPLTLSVTFLSPALTLNSLPVSIRQSFILPENSRPLISILWIPFHFLLLSF